jgi:hypothetical protein
MRYVLESSNTEAKMQVVLASMAALLFVATGQAQTTRTERKADTLVLAQTVCPEVEQPVCATKDGKRVRYGNDCKARRDGATDITPGECAATR